MDSVHIPPDTDVNLEADTDLHTAMIAVGKAARKACMPLAKAESVTKNNALRMAASALRDHRDALLEANARDVQAAEAAGSPSARIDRLRLDPGRIEAMAVGLETVAALDDPVGQVLKAWRQPNGLEIRRVAVPLGVIGVIYESRPNVTADAAALCMKAGNAVILRPGSESRHSSSAIFQLLDQAFCASGLPAHSISMVPTFDRAAVRLLLQMADYVDVIVPRGGRGLIERVQREARMPVFAHLEGVCHVYLDAGCDHEKAHAIAMNAKMRRTGICGAMEGLLVHRSLMDDLAPRLISSLHEQGCELRGDAAFQALDSRVRPAQESDWGCEHLDAILSLRCVDGLTQAIDYIHHYGSNHTDSIVSEDAENVARFMAEIDSAIVMHNASTQFADGAEFGMGAEIGIATGRMHARGPIGVAQLTCYKYQVFGDGHCRK